MNRWASRKFILAMVAQIAGFFVLLWPEHDELIQQLSQSLAGLLVIAISATTYVASEASIDRQRAANTPSA